MMYYLMDVVNLTKGDVELPDLAELYQKCFFLSRESRLTVRGLWFLDVALQIAHSGDGDDQVKGIANVRT